jgi:N-acetylmuramoyl-L-alanine amidase
MRSHRLSLRRLLPLAFALVSLVAPGGMAPARADAPVPEGPPVLTDVRAWAAPTNTRVVFDFNLPVTPVMPDSGISDGLVITVPGEGVVLPDSVAQRLRPLDGAVDSLSVVPIPTGLQLRVWFADTTRFRAFTLIADEDKPFRLVVDVMKPGAAAEEAQRLAAIAAQKRRERLRIVVIDAGHGGEDAGARGQRGRLLEKNVTLAVARAVAIELGKVPGIKPLLTRDSDYFIPLRERYRIAERANADLFISIHANSSRRRVSNNGTEVYFLSLKGASDQADADLADLENAADKVGGVPQQAEDDLVSILYDVKRSSAMQQSQILAESLLEHITTDRRLEVRGVKQAGFVVLKSVEFPSVLVEVAFINNPTEAKLLASKTFQQQVARELAKGVKRYFERVGIPLVGEAVGGDGGGGATGQGAGRAGP